MKDSDMAIKSVLVSVFIDNLKIGDDYSKVENLSNEIKILLENNIKVKTGFDKIYIQVYIEDCVDDY